jgi:hypothetical protein
MSITTAIFRKDARQFRLLIVLLPALLAVLVAVRLGLTGSIAPDPTSNVSMPPFHEGLLALVCIVLAGILMSYVIFEGSPGRPERFQATRPVPLRSLLLAKSAFLAAFVIAPFALAAVFYLMLSGMPASVVGLGTVQSLVRTLVLLGFGVPLMLLWETRRRLVAGIVATGLGIAGFVTVDGLFAARGSLFLPFRTDIFFGSLTQVVCFAIAAGILLILAAVHLRRPLGLWPRLTALLLTGAAAPLLGALATAHRLASPAAGPAPVAMASCAISHNNRQNGVSIASINLKPDAATPTDEKIVWNFSRLTVGGREIPLPARRNPRLFPSSYLHDGTPTLALSAEIRQPLGPDWALVAGRMHGRSVSSAPAGAWAPEAGLPAEPATLDAVLQGHRFSWQPVAELPLIPGSSVRDGDSIWTFHGSGRADHGPFRLSLTHKGPELWLRPGNDVPRFDDASYSVVLLDPKRRFARFFQNFHWSNTELASDTACPRRGLLIDMDGFDESPNLVNANLESFRLLILRARYEGTRFYRWTSPAPLAFRDTSPNRPSGFANDKRDLKAADIARWIERHPGPAADAPAAAVARYLVAILEQTNRCRRLEEKHPAVTALAAYVPTHFNLFLRALDSLHMDQHASSRLLEHAIAAGIEHRQLPDLVTRLSTNSNMMQIVEKRGWTADIAADLARLIRNGNHDRKLLMAARGLPDTAGITRDEWLAIFRLHPGADTYRILRQIPGLEPRLAAEVDACMARQPPLLESDGDPLLALAIVRGHPRGPALLHQAVGYSMQLNEHNAHEFSNIIKSNFDLSGCPNHHGDSDIFVPWFLAQDPASFTYDPATRLYTAPKR